MPDNADSQRRWELRSLERDCAEIRDLLTHRFQREAEAALSKALDALEVAYVAQRRRPKGWMGIVNEAENEIMAASNTVFALKSQIPVGNPDADVVDRIYRRLGSILTTTGVESS